MAIPEQPVLIEFLLISHRGGKQSSEVSEVFQHAMLFGGTWWHLPSFYNLVRDKSSQNCQRGDVIGAILSSISSHSFPVPVSTSNYRKITHGTAAPLALLALLALLAYKVTPIR